MSSEEGLAPVDGSSARDSPRGRGASAVSGPDAREEQQPRGELRKEKERLRVLWREEEELLMKIEEARAALSQEDALQEGLRQQEQIRRRLPERGVHLAELAPRSADAPAFRVKSRLLYPMEGGTALLTFEAEEVARQVLEMRRHTLHLDPGYRISVEAQPVRLPVPRQLEVEAGLSARCVLLSQLPRMDPESLLDKLGFHFSRTANGGGDVHSCQMMEDTWTAALTFAEDDVAGALLRRQFQDVRVQNSTHRVRVSPSVSGEMSGLQVRMQACSRTVLLTGIPDVLEPEALQDLLVVHFQRKSAGGGEVLQCLYNPLGRRALALFSGQGGA